MRRALALLGIAAAIACGCERESREAADERPPVAATPPARQPGGEPATEPLVEQPDETESDAPAPPGEPPAAPAAAPPEAPGAMPPAAAGAPRTGCEALLPANDLRRHLREAPSAGEVGGLAGGRNSWAALVDRSGRLCAVVVSTDDPTAAWPGSRAIAMAKAYTANAFSSDDQPLSTARLYTLTQPGHSLWGLAAGNPFDPGCLEDPAAPHRHVGRVCGGTISFGGGLPLYRDGRRVGGLGVSGDTACADHEIAKRVRKAAGLEPPGGASADDIRYASDGPSPFTHPLCADTWRNGERIGDEAPSQGY